MITKQIAQPKYEIKTMAKYSSDGEHRYSLSYDWSGDEPEKAIMVITNHPGKSDGVTTDLTTSLIINNVKAMNFNKVVMTNLFSKISLANEPNGVSTSSFTSSTDMITLLEAKEVETIVIATGSFPRNNKLACKRQQELIEQLKQAGLEDKLQVLVDGTNKPVHPLATGVRNGWSMIKF
ncbi:DUF1643 domain-containing protein [Lentilactobacillus senioris]|uniref:DUF1643 domain-containing protein n=1 Tax=Lentilactobacillus senioris TaxID=931534 RepID=UPI002282BF39|nr:DUF1643 domain-containing protein [Lentilactobacillus senioris]MCY9806095.1 DUF1643 domain-containing protein [Lentilactobacillus senioris]